MEQCHVIKLITFQVTSQAVDCKEIMVAKEVVIHWISMAMAILSDVTLIAHTLKRQSLSSKTSCSNRFIHSKYKQDFQQQQHTDQFSHDTSETFFEHSSQTDLIDDLAKEIEQSVVLFQNDLEENLKED